MTSVFLKSWLQPGVLETDTLNLRVRIYLELADILSFNLLVLRLYSTAKKLQ